MHLFSTITILSALASSPLAKATPPTPACIAGPVTVTRCRVECGADRSQRDHRSFKAASFQACISACIAEAQCVTAQYQRGSYHCYFKNSSKSARVDSGVDSILCGVTISSTTTGFPSITTRALSSISVIASLTTRFINSKLRDLNYNKLRVKPKG